MNSQKVTDLIHKLQNFRIVPVVSLPSVRSAVKLSEVLLRCGLPVVEITFRTASGADGMEAIRKEYPEMMLLAGTVLTVEQVDIAISSGASAIVSPGFSGKTVEYCQKKDIPYLPGVCTPSEVQAAMDKGLEVLKFFPAENAGGIKTVSLFKSIYQDVRFMPTGGINPENVRSYLEQDNVVCCGGTWLSPEKMMAEGKWDEIERRIASAIDVVNR